MRWPLGLEYSAEDIANEAPETTVVARREGKVIATMQLRAVSANLLKVRQVAVADEVQGQGVGREMNRYAEDWIHEQGFSDVVLHARAHVIPFYEKQGYAVEGEEFTEVGIPHRKMTKKLI